MVEPMEDVCDLVDGVSPTAIGAATAQSVIWRADFEGRPPEMGLDGVDQVAVIVRVRSAG